MGCDDRMRRNERNDVVAKKTKAGGYWIIRHNLLIFGYKATEQSVI